MKATPSKRTASILPIFPYLLCDDLTRLSGAVLPTGICCAEWAYSFVAERASFTAVACRVRSAASCGAEALASSYETGIEAVSL